MKKVLLLLAFLSSSGQAYQTVFNPFTSKLDYVGVSSGAIPSGSSNYIQNTLTPTTTSQLASLAQVQVTSNTILSGASFYQNGPIILGQYTKIVSSIAVTNSAGTGNPTPALVDIYSNTAPASGGQLLFSVGSLQQSNQFVISDQNPLNLTRYGINSGQLNIGVASFIHQIYDAQSNQQFINWWNGGEMDIQTATNGNGGKDILFLPQTIETFRVSNTVGVKAYGTESVGGSIYISIGDQTINTTTETSGFSGTCIGTTTIAANFFTAGKKFRMEGNGIYSTPLGNVSTIQINVKYGSTVVGTVTTGSLPASASNLPFYFWINCTVRTIGVSGSMICNGTFAYDTALTGIVETQNAIISNATTVNTTASKTLDVTATWSAVTTQTAIVQQSSIDFKD